MVITKIEQQKKNKDRYSLYIDDAFYCGVYSDVVVRFALKTGREINQKELDEIEDNELYHKAWDVFLRYIGGRIRSEYEVVKKLKSKEYSDNLIDRIIKKAKEYKLIDDTQFASLFIRDRINFKQKGKKALSFELKNKGLQKDIIESVLSDISADKELELATMALAKKYKDLDILEKDRAVRFLASRGFSWDTIKKALEKKVNM